LGVECKFELADAAGGDGELRSAGMIGFDAQALLGGVAVVGEPVLFF
jgi:hypothetical protein